MSHWAGVASIRSPRSSSSSSAVVSPVSFRVCLPPAKELSLDAQALYRASSCSWKGTIYTALPLSAFVQCLRMANSAQTVFPLPVGEPTKMLSSDWNSALKFCVWILLNCCQSGYRSTYSCLFKAATGRGCRSKAGVCGGVSRVRLASGMIVRACSQHASIDHSRP